MARSENRKGQETPMNIVAGKIRAMYVAPVIDIMQQAADKPLCIVTGAFGIGKSTYLVPMLQERYTSQGISVQTIDNQGAPSAQALVRAIDRLPMIEGGERGVLLLDEAGAVVSMDGTLGATSALEAASKKGYNVMAIIAHPADSNDVRDQGIQAWEEAAKGSPVIQLPLFRFNNDSAFAREFLLAVADNSHDSFAPEVIDYIISTIPANMNLLYILGLSSDEMATIEDARRVISRYPDRLRTLFTEEELTQFWERLYPTNRR